MGFRGNVHIRMHAIVNVRNRNVYIFITLSLRSNKSCALLYVMQRAKTYYIACTVSQNISAS